MLIAVESPQQGDSVAAPTGKVAMRSTVRCCTRRSLLRGGPRDDEREARIDGGSTDLLQRDDGESNAQIDMGRDGSRSGDQRLHVRAAIVRRHGAGEPPASWTTLPSIAIVAI